AASGTGKERGATVGGGGASAARAKGKWWCGAWGSEARAPEVMEVRRRLVRAPEVRVVGPPCEQGWAVSGGGRVRGGAALAGPGPASPRAGGGPAGRLCGAWTTVEPAQA